MTDEYIRKQDALDAFNRAVQDVGILDADDIETVFGMLSSADVVPVVRCRNCKHLRITHTGMLWCKHEKGLPKPEYEGFCSYGDRRK